MGFWFLFITKHSAKVKCEKTSFHRIFLTLSHYVSLRLRRFSIWLLREPLSGVENFGCSGVPRCKDKEKDQARPDQKRIEGGCGNVYDLSVTNEI